MSFISREFVFEGRNCTLTHPCLAGPEWTPDNLHLRSIVTCDGKAISRGWPKFFNLGESPACYPDPNKFNDWRLEEKLDGSLIIVSRPFEGGGLMVRTRQSTGVEMEGAAEEVKALLGDFNAPHGYSYLFEYVSPKVRIIVRYPEPKLVFLAVIENMTGRIWPAHPWSGYDMTNWSWPADVGSGFDIPKVHDFGTLTEVTAFLKENKSMEGFVLSYNQGQNRVKLKTDWYLKLHRLKAMLGSTRAVMDIYQAEGFPTDEAFRKHLASQLDWELVKECEPTIQQISEARGLADTELLTVRELTSSLDGDRKTKALAIQAQLPRHLWGSAFRFMEGRNVDPKQMRDLMDRHLYPAGEVVAGS